MRELASIQKRNQKLSCTFNVLGFNEGVGYTSETKAKKPNSLCETAYRLAQQEAMLSQETRQYKAIRQLCGKMELKTCLIGEP